MCVGRYVRVHPVRVLLHVVPFVLVEPGPVPRTRGADAGVQVDHRLPGRVHGGAAGSGERRHEALPVSHHHELQQGVTQGFEPRQGDRQGQDHGSLIVQSKAKGGFVTRLEAAAPVE